MKKIKGVYKIFSIGHYLKDKCKFVNIKVPDEIVSIEREPCKLVNDIDICNEFKEHDYDEMKDKLICQKSVNTSLNLPNPYFTRARMVIYKYFIIMMIFSIKLVIKETMYQLNISLNKKLKGT